MLHYLVIGNGRMATHFCHYLNLLRIPHDQWSRQHDSISTLSTLIKPHSVCLILINDSAIESFVEQHLKTLSKKPIHFSGQLAIETAFSAHPLMTFNQTLYEQTAYESMPFIIEENSPEFAELLPGLPNHAFKIPRALKPYYHALCVLSGNFTCLLWEKFFRELTNTLQLPKTIALPYLQQITKNLSTDFGHAVTGPISRGDKTTIAANLEALKDDKFKIIYDAFLTLHTSGEKNEHS